MKSRVMRQRDTGGDELLSVFDLMVLTGESESAWRRRLARGDLPIVRLGSNLRVRRRDLERYFDEHTTIRKKLGVSA